METKEQIMKRIEEYEKKYWDREKYRYAVIYMDAPVGEEDIEQMKKILDEANPEWWGKVDMIDLDLPESFRFRFKRAVLDDDNIEEKVLEWWNSDCVQNYDYVKELVERKCVLRQLIYETICGIDNGIVIDARE